MAGEATPRSDPYFGCDGRNLGGAGRDGEGAREAAAFGVRPGGHRPQRQAMLRVLPICLRRVAEDEPGSTRPDRLVALQRARRAYPQGLGLDPRRCCRREGLYASCLDEATIETKGLKPFEPELERIAALKDQRELAAEIARLHLIGAAAMFYFSSTPDYTDAAMMIAEAYQDGFALPDRDYYLTDDYKSERAEYRHHLERIFRLLGDDTKKAKAAADATLGIETALAKAAMSLVDRREPKKHSPQDN